MKLLVCLLLACWLGASGPIAAQVADSLQSDSLALAQARLLTHKLTHGDFKTPASRLTPQVAKVITADRLGMIWKQLGMQLGRFDSSGTTALKKVRDSLRVFETPLYFERGALGLQLGLNDSLQIAGLYFTPMNDPRAKWELPSYAKPDRYTEQAVEIPAGTVRLRGTLTLPNDRKTPPVVLFIHGSGPNDQDESIGPNKPFKDLAVGLASRGIGSLRFDKRTFAHAEELLARKPDFTVRDEVLDDAKSVYTFLVQNYRKQIGPVYVLGHSLGGMLMPRLAADLPQARGLILLAAPARPLEDLILEQTRYLLGLDSLPLDSMQQAHLDETIAARQRVKELSDGHALNPDEKPPFGLPVAYWRDLAQHPPLKEVAAFGKRPIILLQGGRDYQVTTRDFELWQKALDKRSETSTHLLPFHNHLFMAGIGSSRPDEYLRPDHVGHDVIESLARWIDQNP